MTSSETTLDLRPATVDLKRERVYLRCFTCKRIREELTRETLLHQARSRQSHTLGFYCEPCGRHTEFHAGMVESWLDEIYRERERSMHEYYDYKHRIRHEYMADYKLEYRGPGFGAITGL